MREVEGVDGQRIALDDENRAGGVATSLSQTTFPISQQQAPTIKAFGNRARSQVPFSSATSTSFPPATSATGSQHQRPRDEVFSSSTRPGMPSSSITDPGSPSTVQSQQTASMSAFGSSTNRPLSASGVPQQFMSSNAPSGMQTPGTYTGPDGRIKKIPRGASGNRCGN